MTSCCYAILFCAFDQFVILIVQLKVLRSAIGLLHWGLMSWNPLLDNFHDPLLLQQ